MSYSFEKNNVTGLAELVIKGFEAGIADSPYQGITDMRNYNITTSPKQANVEFAMAAVTLPPTGYTSIAWSSDTATDVFTVASTAGFYTGMALTIVTVSGAGSGTAGQTYYVGNITPTTFKLYTAIDTSAGLDVTTNRTGTYTVPTFGTPTDSVSSPYSTLIDQSGFINKLTFIMTSDGKVWSLTFRERTGIPAGTIAINTLQFLGNLLHSSAANTAAAQTGLVVWKNYLFAFMDTKIDYISIINATSGQPSATWVYAWKTTISSSFGGHRGIAATDDALYFCNGPAVGSILENAGSTFDPTSAPTYTFSISALALPAYDTATCLAQLGVNLLVGGALAYVYPWDRVSTSFNYPLIVAESFVKCIVSTNSTAYVFAGQRGRIYITNGSNIDLFAKFPDDISNTVNPYYSWGWAIYLKNQLFFSLSVKTNSGTTISNYAGVWAYNLEPDKKSLRLSNSLSYGTYVGTVPVLVPMGAILPTGEGIYAGWLNGTGGIDYTSANPYSNFEARIDTEIIPVGTFLSPDTFSNIEFKLAKPLVTGESIRLSQRSNLTDSFTVIGTTTTAGLLSDVYPANFENVQWLQIRIESSSTATTPSYVPLLEVRLRR